ncbi:alpha/beta hydrolase [Marinobacter sp. M3C]|uniref:alpha/beta hydrolase n=1 Tax=Marinobacter sp. M3C TaxID=2917715 RepID=UPI00200EBC3C|nr:alpha/beta hydrolase [Marinobacter sp. M3C]UQG58649.1 alpha/beta hydrolase [Marinobacter sp. M3C]UQG59532.1 alpha/beta hydrolase [Marinobacter sp. M3C]
MTLTGNLPFSPSTTPLGAHGAPVCKRETANVLLSRSDTLGRPRAFIDAGKIEDESGRSFTATLQNGTEHTPDNAEARFTKLLTGNAQWYGPEEPKGEHLIGFDTVSEQLRFAPGHTLSEGVELTVIQGERKARAIHLPPPVFINLREEASPSEDLLTDDQLDYFRANGNNALIFMHGYNVPHGEWGRFLKYDGSREAYHGNAPSFAKANTWHPNRATVWQDTAALSANSSVSLEDEKLNGGGAHNWAVHMEYQLNRAAGFDGEDWMPYSRIINISWPGDTGSTDFMQAELNAMASGRRLAPLLLQLANAGIAINLLSHSLGARVALTALNIMGIIGKRDLVDHLFLWQPAVADNALTNDSSRDVHPLGLGVFPAAHSAARKIVVLHSRGDGILGADNSEDEAWWRKALSFKHPVATTAWDLATADDPMDDVLGNLRGAYDKKWWTFPSFLDNGFGPAIEKLYTDYLPLTFEAWMTAHPQRSLATPETLKQTVQENWTRLEKDILTEANALWQPCIDCLRNGERPPDYTLLAPLNHNASVSPQMAKDYVLRLKKLAANNWAPEQRPRPALGYVGFEEVTGETAGPFRDKFLEDRLLNESWLVVDQSRWLFSHSGMRIPTQELFEEVYQRQIMKNRLLANSKFGRY